jgi:hypothetical protein
MPHRHHRHTDHDVDLDDDRSPLTIVDTDPGMLGHVEREAIADAVEALDADDLAPEEAALHVERYPDDSWREA